MKKLELKNNFFVSIPAPININSIQNWLLNQMLHGKVSRARTRFLKLIQDRITETDKERVKLLEEYAERKKVMEEIEGKNGKKEKKEVEKVIFLYYWCPDCKEEIGIEDIIGKGKELKHLKCGQKLEEKETFDGKKGKKYKMSDEGQEKFKKQYDEYLQETLVIDVTPANRETIYEVRELILDTKQEFSGVMASRYDEWCEALENISEEKEK